VQGSTNTNRIILYRVCVEGSNFQDNGTVEKTGHRILQHAYNLCSWYSIIT